MTAELPGIHIEMPPERVLLNDEDVTEAIRTPEVSQGASKVAAIPQVRAFLVPQQQRIAEGRDIVCEGRDQGTVVFPHAPVKFYHHCRCASAGRAAIPGAKCEGRCHDAGTRARRIGRARSPRQRAGRRSVATAARRYRHRHHAPHSGRSSGPAGRGNPANGCPPEPDRPALLRLRLLVVVHFLRFRVQLPP